MMESEIAGWLSIVLRFVHVLAAIMWIGNSILFTWMEFNLLPPAKDEEGKPKDPDLLGTLDMLHGGGVFHLQKRILKPGAIPVPLHWFMWQSYTTWITGVLLIISVFYIHGGSSLLNPESVHLQGWKAIALSAGGIIGWWILYDSIWRTPLKDHPKIGVPLTLILLMGAAFFFAQYFNGRAVFLQIGAMMGSAMSSNVFFHIILNQKRFMKNLEAGKPHDMKFGKQAKTRSLHNHYMTFPVLFLMLSAHFPQLTSAQQKVPILGVIILALVLIKFLMNSRYFFRHWLVSIFGTFIAACAAIALLLSSTPPAVAGEDPAIAAGAQLFINQGCAACHQMGAAQIAPDLQGIFGTPQLLTDKSTIIADEAYLRTSIQQPALHVVDGFAPAMPSYAHLSPEQLDQIVAYIKSLK